MKYCLTTITLEDINAARKNGNVFDLNKARVEDKNDPWTQADMDKELKPMTAARYNKMYPKGYASHCLQVCDDASELKEFILGTGVVLEVSRDELIDAHMVGIEEDEKLKIEINGVPKTLVGREIADFQVTWLEREYKLRTKLLKK